LLESEETRSFEKSYGIKSTLIIIGLPQKLEEFSNKMKDKYSNCSQILIEKLQLIEDNNVNIVLDN
jgi:hypothetical protein